MQRRCCRSDHWPLLGCCRLEGAGAVEEEEIAASNECVVRQEDGKRAGASATLLWPLLTRDAIALFPSGFLRTRAMCAHQSNIARMVVDAPDSDRFVCDGRA